MIEPAEQGPARGRHEHGVRRQVAVRDLRLAAVRVVEGGEHVADHRDLLVERQGQRALLDVLPQRVPGHVRGHQDVAILGLGRKELPHGENVRVTGQRRHRPVGVLDATAFLPALVLRAVRIDRVHAEPGRAAALGAEERVPGTVLRVPVGPAEPLLHLPRAKARRPFPRLGAADDRLLHRTEVPADVGRASRRDAGLGLEKGDALPEVRHRRPILAAGVLDEGIGCRHQHRGVDVQAAERPVRRVLVADQRLQRLCVPAQNRERRMIWRAPLRVPLAAVDVDVTAGALDVNHVDAVWTD